MYTEELKYKISLNSLTELGPIRFNRLLGHFGSAKNAQAAPLEELKSIEGISENLARKIKNIQNTFDPEKEVTAAQKADIKITVPENSDYPGSLKNTFDPPVVLYYRGDFLETDQYALGVVGTRKPTNYGKVVTDKLVQELAGLNICIVSGLARGIDTCAHTSCLKAKGRTIAVLGSGLLVHYPPENRKLEEQVALSGAVVSEFCLSAAPDQHNFPRRNRIIAGLSLGTLVVESDIKSGALITARFAAEQGKDVFAVPGSIVSQYSRGPHYLLKQGAKLVESAEDILEEIAALAGRLSFKKQEGLQNRDELPLLNSREQLVLARLEEEPQGLHIDTLQNNVKKPFSELSEILVSLELKNLIKSLPGKIYMKV